MLLVPYQRPATHQYSVVWYLHSDDLEAGAFRLRDFELSCH